MFLTELVILMPYSVLLIDYEHILSEFIMAQRNNVIMQFSFFPILVCLPILGLSLSKRCVLMTRAIEEDFP